MHGVSVNYAYTGSQLYGPGWSGSKYPSLNGRARVVHDIQDLAQLLQLQDLLYKNLVHSRFLGKTLQVCCTQE